MPSSIFHPLGPASRPRIGCVRYLNSRPLIHDHAREVRFAHPSVLADDLAAGQLDAALCPVWEWLRADPARYVAADGVAIAARGAVHSVFLAHRGEVGELRRIRLDPSSRSSANLLRVLLAEFHGAQPEFTEFPAASLDDPPQLRTGEGLLLIGDQANRFRARGAENAPGLALLDLAAEWRARTSRPFVFAAWLIRAELRGAAELANKLRAWKEHGLAHMDEVVHRQREAPPEFARWYLTRCIAYALGRAEKAGLREYARLLAKHGLIPAAPGRGALRWV